jgi:hypothetical protein
MSPATILAFALLGSPAGPAAASGDGPLAGVWGGPNGAKVELRTDAGGKVIGTLVGDGGPCPLPAGTEVLRGALLDDSLGAQVRLCLLAPSCGKDPNQALAILLVTKQLTGGVHTKAACAAEVKALVLRRPGPQAPVVAPTPTERLSATPSPSTKVSAPVAVAQPGAAPGQPPARPAEPVTLASNSEKLPAPAAQSPAAAAVKVAKAEEVPVGQIPGRPVGLEHPDGYDPRDARKGARPPPRSPVETLLFRGRDLLATGEFEKARGVFLEALAKEPTRAEAYNGVGVSFYGRLDLDEALAWYKRALEADPQFGDAYYNIACAYALLHRKPLAFRYLRLAALNRYFERQKFEEDPDLESLLGEPEMKELLAQMAQEDREDKAEKAGNRGKQGKPGKPPGSARP